MPASLIKDHARPAYQLINAPGGAYRVYPDGRRVFVPHAATPAPVNAMGPGVGGLAPDRTRTTPNTSPYGTVTPKPPTTASPPPAATPVPQGGADPAPFQPDAEYYAGAAERTFQAGEQRATLDQQSTYSTTDFNEALRRLLEKQPKDVQAAREAANRQGLLFSGTLGRQEGEINTSYLRQQSDLRQGYDREAAAREAARRAIEAGLSVDDAAARAAAVDRQTTRDTASADAGTLASEAPKPKPAANKTDRTVKRKRGSYTPGTKRRHAAGRF
jgi:hypothetical protein